jgi:hypothetical protein
MDSETHRAVTEYAFMLLMAEASSTREPFFINQVPSEYIERVVSTTAELNKFVGGELPRPPISPPSSSSLLTPYLTSL